VRRVCPREGNCRAAFTFMEELVAELSTLKTEAVAREALRAFIAVRRAYVPKYAVKEGETRITPEQLISVIKALIRDDSEGGKRAQAVVAGLMDVFAGVDRVESGRINDPSRKYPGDNMVRVGLRGYGTIWGLLKTPVSHPFPYSQNLRRLPGSPLIYGSTARSDRAARDCYGGLNRRSSLGFG
jgi:hypothetical protein